MNAQAEQQAPSQRIVTLDVIRGFALLGMGVANVEWFNRPFADHNGMPAGDMGGSLHAWMTWLVYTFVHVKFGVIFAILFGMSFAVMLASARASGREFIRPYLRRIAMLAVFGLLHGVLLWTGDILLDYALAAGLLLLVLFGTLRQGCLFAGSLLALAAMTQSQWVLMYVLLVGVAGLVGLYLRDERRVELAGGTCSPLGAALLAFALFFSVTAVADRLFLDLHKSSALLVWGLALFVLALASRRYREPVALRPVRIGALLYVAMFVATAVGAGLTLLVPATVQETPAFEQQAMAIQRQSDRVVSIAEETELMRHGSYPQAVRFRAELFAREHASNGLFLVMLLGLFLIGNWFVQSGRMLHPHRYLYFYRRLALSGLFVGGAFALASSFLALRPGTGTHDSTWDLATSLRTISNLPLALGYMATVVLAVHHRWWSGVFGWLAPAGRMALTNYLTQSLVAGAVFYGYGMGLWGAGRAWQVLYVACLFVAQVILSRWWMARFRYGPLEWVWRWFTYGYRPGMRV